MNYYERIEKEKAFLKTEEEIELFNKLKAKRLELAKEQNIAPYLIFHDTALIHMVKQRPQTEMSQISGVGAMKLEKYEVVFLGVMWRYLVSVKSSTYIRSFSLLSHLENSLMK